MMLLRTTIFLLASLSLGVVDAAVRKCHSTKPQKKLEQDEARFAKLAPTVRFRAQAGVDTAAIPEPQTVEIPVHWHVISKDQTVQGGNMPEAFINNTIEAMNGHYADTGFQFRLVGIDRTVNRDWFRNVDMQRPAERQMKTRLRKGAADHLNIYTVGFENPDLRGLLGYATFPDDYESLPKLDGVVMLHTSVVGGAAEGYNLGGTITHEVGHWLGLYHTFEGGCTGLGDHVEDTPAEEEDQNDSCVRKDTCPDQPGLDLINNFMTYAFDSCYTEFTPGQIERMHAQWTTFRN